MHSTGYIIHIAKGCVCVYDKTKEGISVDWIE